MKAEQIYELISGKLLKILENQPDEIKNCQEKLDNFISNFKESLTTEQQKQLDELIEIYTEYITLNDNFHFECGFNIGNKLGKII